MGDNLEWTREHPVSFVQWVPAEQVHANDYNPNVVAQPERDLLRLSIEYNGVVQPILVYEREDGEYEIIDGFHRSDVLRKELGFTHLPIVLARPDRTDRESRLEGTVHLNRAKGKHTISGDSNLVLELAKRNWSDSKIAKRLGMDMDEVLRLKQITGLSELFSDKDFSEAWEI